MARTDNYSQFICDRCGQQLYAQPSSPDAQKWAAIRRVSAAGSDVSRLLCPTCASAYQTFTEGQERDFVQFMKGGE